MSVLEDWMGAVCLELGLDRGDIDRDLVLDLARDVAHGVARPGAPLTAYLLGLAVGRGAAARDAAARLTELAEDWQRDETDTAEKAGAADAKDAAGPAREGGTAAGPLHGPATESVLTVFPKSAQETPSGAVLQSPPQGDSPTAR